MRQVEAALEEATRGKEAAEGELWKLREALEQAMQDERELEARLSEQVRCRGDPGDW